MQVIHITVQEAYSMGHIDTNIMKFLINQHPRVPVFYLLPKNHKIFAAGEFLPGRPIVSGTGSDLEPLTQFLD